MSDEVKDNNDIQKAGQGDANKEQAPKPQANTPNVEVEVVQPATLESLSKVKYQNLLYTFTVLGVPEAWKPGSKAKKMIAEALEKLAIIKELKDKGLEGQELEDAKRDAYNKASEATAKAIEQETIEKETAKAKKDQSLYEEIKAKGFSKEQLAEVKTNLDANLKNSPSEGARKILLEKRAVCIELLEDPDYEGGLVDAKEQE